MALEQPQLHLLVRWFLVEPPHDKNRFLICENKGPYQLCSNCEITVETVLTEYPQSVFWNKNKKYITLLLCYTLVLL